LYQAKANEEYVVASKIRIKIEGIKKKAKEEARVAERQLAKGGKGGKGGKGNRGGRGGGGAGKEQSSGGESSSGGGDALTFGLTDAPTMEEWERQRGHPWEISEEIYRHPGSLNFQQGEFEHPWLVYYEKVGSFARLSRPHTFSFSHFLTPRFSSPGQNFEAMGA
jgi:hypothetical protein